MSQSNLFQLNYSPRCITGAGLFDGEGTERLWSYLGNFKTITKEMTLENRTDLLVEALMNYGDKLTRKLGSSLFFMKTADSLLNPDNSNQILK